MLLPTCLPPGLFLHFQWLGLVSWRHERVVSWRHMYLIGPSFTAYFGTQRTGKPYFLQCFPATQNNMPAGTFLVITRLAISFVRHTGVNLCLEHLWPFLVNSSVLRRLQMSGFSLGSEEGHPCGTPSCSICFSGILISDGRGTHRLVLTQISK